METKHYEILKKKSFCQEEIAISTGVLAHQTAHGEVHAFTWILIELRLNADSNHGVYPIRRIRAHYRHIVSNPDC